MVPAKGHLEDQFPFGGTPCPVPWRGREGNLEHEHTRASTEAEALTRSNAIHRWSRDFLRPTANSFLVSDSSKQVVNRQGTPGRSQRNALPGAKEEQERPRDMESDTRLGKTWLEGRGVSFFFFPPFFVCFFFSFSTRWIPVTRIVALPLACICTK